MFLTSKLFEQHGLPHGFGTRRGGVSLPPYDSLNVTTNHGDEPERVAHNLKLIAARFGITVQEIFWLHQVSGEQIITLQEPIDHQPVDVDTIRQTAGDALLWSRPLHPPGQGEARASGKLKRRFLAVRTADCLPAFLVAPKQRIAAVVHLGWQGARLKLLAKTIDRLVSLGVSASELLVALGPAIGPCCLRLSGAIAKAFTQEFAQSRAWQMQPGEAITLDLWQHSQELAVGRGVLPTNIDTLHYCTSCNPLKFFSYRRDGERTGRLLNLLGFTD